MKILDRFSRGRAGSQDVGERHLADVDTRRREAVTHVVRPDSLSASAVPSGTRPVEPDVDAETVKAAIRALHHAGGLDEFVPDNYDGVIATWLDVWDARVDEHLHQQVLTSLRLAGQEIENLAACLSRVQALRVDLADLDHEVDCWRGVLRGEITTLPFPAATTPTPADDVDALIEGGLLGRWGRHALDRGSWGGAGTDNDGTDAVPLVPVPRHLPHPDQPVSDDAVTITREEHA